MKAAFALLADQSTSNLVRKLAWNFHRTYRTGTIGSRLPPHISLKQPFQVSDLEALSSYMEGLAKSIRPFEVELTEFQLIHTMFEEQETGIIWIEARESRVLRALHERLNLELDGLFGNTQADFDGPNYHFHMTVALGRAGGYEQIFANLPDKRVDLAFTVRELAMFVYDEPLGPQGEFITYQVLPLR